MAADIIRWVVLSFFYGDEVFGWSCLYLSLNLTQLYKIHVTVPQHIIVISLIIPFTSSIASGFPPTPGCESPSARLTVIPGRFFTLRDSTPPSASPPSKTCKACLPERIPLWARANGSCLCLRRGLENDVLLPLFPCSPPRRKS